MRRLVPRHHNHHRARILIMRLSYVCLIDQTSVIDESTITEASRDVLAMVDRLRAFMETKSAAGCTLSCPVSCLRLEGDAGDDGKCNGCDLILLVASMIARSH